MIENLAPLLTEPTVIFGKSTVPVGTAKRLGARARELAPAGDGVDVAWNPEFFARVLRCTIRCIRIGWCSVSTGNGR